MVRSFLILNKHRMPEVKNTFIGLNTNWTSHSIHFLLKFLYKYTAFKQIFTSKLERMKISISQSFQRILISGLLLPLRLADSPTKGIWNLFFSSSWKMESENTTWPSLPNSRLEEPTPLSSPFHATRWRRQMFLCDDCLVQGLRFRSAPESKDALLPKNPIHSQPPTL